MMGHSYYGSKLSDQHRYERKFAWWPVISGSKKRVWLTHYYIRYTFYDNNGKPPIHGFTWTYIYTKNEYLLELLKNETKVY
jgi:hypothetical protein